jgi:hypothetical protein
VDATSTICAWFCVLTTYWYRNAPDRRLHVTDVRAFHRAFGSHRFDTEISERGLLSHDQLLTVAERDAYDPQRRLGLARLGALTPESAPPEQQVWHTYPPVRMPSAEAVIGALTRPETWPDYASEIGRFTPLRAGGLAGQTFEIEVAAGTETGRPIFTRGYVTITQLVTPDDPAALSDWFSAVEDGLARYGDNEPRAVPRDGAPVVGFDLTTHQGHFLGNGHNRLLLYTDAGGGAWSGQSAPGIRCRGTSIGPTGSLAATLSTPSGARARWSVCRCCTSSPAKSPREPARGDYR